jgi:hypothetical protein
MRILVDASGRRATPPAGGMVQAEVFPRFFATAAPTFAPGSIALIAFAAAFDLTVEEGATFVARLIVALRADSTPTSSRDPPAA